MRELCKRGLIVLLALTLVKTQVLGLQTAFAERLPDIGDISSTIMTPAEEKRLGQAFMRSVRSSTTIIDDPLLTDYMSDLGKQLARHTQATGINIDLFLIDDPRINAFAGPAGHIGVFSGLVMTTETESELAAVVSHEISHVKNRDILISSIAATIAAALSFLVRIAFWTGMGRSRNNNPPHGCSNPDGAKPLCGRFFYCCPSPSVFGWYYRSDLLRRSSARKCCPEATSLPSLLVNKNTPPTIVRVASAIAMGIPKCLGSQYETGLAKRKLVSGKKCRCESS